MFVVLALVAFCGHSSAVETANQVVGRITENWRWSHYWFDKTGIDDHYMAGRKVSALVFWNSSDNRPIRGLCSSELGICLAYVGPFLDPEPRRMTIAPEISDLSAFTTFVGNGFQDRSHLLAIRGTTVTDFQRQQLSILLPVLEPPSAILHHDIPSQARTDAEEVKRVFRCSEEDSKAPTEACSGSLVFAYHGAEDPYWFVLRSCSQACEFRGESVEMLRRGDHGWEVTSAGFIDRPQTEVDRLKQQIEKAEMFRLRLP